MLQISPVAYNAVDSTNVLDIHRYLMKETWWKIMFGFIKNVVRDY